MPLMPELNLELCNGCGLCIAVCPCGAFRLAGGVITLVETEECGYCTECEAVCPVGAIRCPYEIVIERRYEYRWRVIGEP